MADNWFRVHNSGGWFVRYRRLSFGSRTDFAPLTERYGTGWSLHLGPWTLRWHGRLRDG